MAGWLAKQKQKEMQQKQEELIRYYQEHPDQWVEHVFGVQFWEKQREIFLDAWNNRYVAVRSSFASGKSFLSACLVMAWVHLQKDAIALTTAPSMRQVAKNVWQVIHQLYERSRIPLGSELLQTEIRVGPGWYALGFSTDEPEKLQGIHPSSGKLLIVVDESAAVPAPIHQRLLALMTSGGSHVLHIGNPLEVGTLFHGYFSDPKYVKHAISAFDTPNVREGREVVPGLISRTWIEERRAEWGEDSPLWQSQVLGEFPEASENTLIPLSWIHAAQDRWYDASPSGFEVAGVDVARYGSDESVCCIVSGDYVHPLKTWQGASTAESVGYVKSYAGGAKLIRIDEIGMGAGVVDQAKEQGMPVMGVNVQTRADDPERFYNRRAQLYWKLRERLNPESANALALPPDDTLAAQLAAIRYRIVDSGGKIKIESKDEMRARGLRSPDRADALMLAVSESLGSVLTAAPVMVGVGTSYWDAY